MPWRQVRGVKVELHSFLTLALDLGGVSGKLQAPATLAPGKNSGRYPLNRSLFGPQSCSRSFGEHKNLLTQDRQMLNGINIDTCRHFQKHQT
jgi:hypothetical protein